MIKSAVHRRVMLNAAGSFNSRVRLRDLHDFHSAAALFEKGARAARTFLRRDARREIEQGLADLAAERARVGALVELERVIARWREAEITVFNEDCASWELGAALRAAGVSRPARDRVKEALIGPKCPVCSSRLCPRTPRECDEHQWALWYDSWDD